MNGDEIAELASRLGVAPDVMAWRRCARCGGPGQAHTAPGRSGYVVLWEHARWCPIRRVVLGAARPRDEYDYLDGAAAPFEPSDYTEDRQR